MNCFFQITLEITRGFVLLNFMLCRANRTYLLTAYQFFHGCALVLMIFSIYSMAAIIFTCGVTGFD